MNQRTIFPLFLLLAACGGGDRNESGYTSCGSQTCQPGQYCAEAIIGICSTGCTSDANCQDGHVCQNISDVIGTGTCSEDQAPVVDPPPPPKPSGDPLAECQAACDAFQVCGLAVAEVAECRHDCTGLTETQQTVVGNCRTMSCGDQQRCLGVDCFSDDDCSGGEQCLGMSCL